MLWSWGGVHSFLLATHLPSQAVALAGVVAKVAHLTVLDIHPRLAHVILRAVFAGLHLGDSVNE